MFVGPKCFRFVMENSGLMNISKCSSDELISLSAFSAEVPLSLFVRVAQPASLSFAVAPPPRLQKLCNQLKNYQVLFAFFPSMVKLKV